MNSDIDNLYCSTPLDTNQIRILHLQPNADFTSDIRGDLEVISLNPGNSQAKTPSKPYRALSYVWGDESNKKPIFVNDIPLNVTSNLVLALRRLRAHHGHEHTPLTLWVDAVCITRPTTSSEATKYPSWEPSINPAPRSASGSAP